MLYRVETGPRAGLDDTQGRKTAQHLRKALKICLAKLTAAKATDTGFSPMAVSVRTCLAELKVA